MRVALLCCDAATLRMGWSTFRMTLAGREPRTNHKQPLAIKYRDGTWLHPSGAPDPLPMYKYGAALKCAAVRAGTATPASSKKTEMPSHHSIDSTCGAPLRQRDCLDSRYCTGTCTVQYGAKGR